LKRALDLLFIALAACVAAAALAAASLGGRASIEMWYWITSLGTEELYVALSILIYYLASPWLGFTAAVSVLLGGALVVDLKNVFMLPRPPNPVFPEEGYGFPSGHAQVSSAFWSHMILATRRWSLAILGIALVSSISISRVALNAHYPRDVAGGALFGSLVGALIAYIYKRIAGSGLTTIYPQLAPLSVGLLSLASYLYIARDPTLLRIAGASIGLSIHPYIYRGADQPPQWSVSERFIAIVFLGAISASTIYATRGAAPPIEFAGYLAIGLLIPLTGYVINALKRSRATAGPPKRERGEES